MLGIRTLDDNLHPQILYDYRAQSYMPTVLFEVAQNRGQTPNKSRGSNLILE